jgi:hypothetical protein
MAIGISPTSAKGDILSFDGSSRSRVAVGTNGQILTARSSAASGIQYETPATAVPVFELISTTTLTANAATVTFSSIPDTYKWLKIVADANSNSTNGMQPIIVLNSDTSKSNYYYYNYRNGATVDSLWGSQQNGVAVTATGNSGQGTRFEIDISKNTATNHETVFFSRSVDNSSSNATIRWTILSAHVSLGASLTSILLKNVTSDVYGSGSSFHLYGRKV